MKIKITDLRTFDSYTVEEPSQAKDSTDRSAAEQVWETGQAVSMGCIVAEPVPSTR